MTTLIVTCALFLSAMLLLPPSMASAELRHLLEGCQGTVPRRGAWRRQDQGVPQVAHQGPVRRVQGGLGEGRKRQGVCG